MDRFAVLLDAWSNEMLFLQCKKDVSLARVLYRTRLSDEISYQPHCNHDYMVIMNQQLLRHAATDVSSCTLTLLVWSQKGHLAYE